MTARNVQGDTRVVALRVQAAYGSRDARAAARFSLAHRDYWTWERRQVYYATLEARLAGREFCPLIPIGVQS